MPLSENVIILIIVATILLSIIFIIILAFQIQKWNNENIRRRRVLPINRLIRLHQLRRQLYQVELDKHYEKQQQVMEQLKKTVVFVNPDRTMNIGICIE